MAQLDDKTLQNLNKRLKEMDEILASDYRKALDLGKAFTQGFSTEQIDAFLRKLGKINRADAAKLNVMFNLVDVNGRPITAQEAKYRIEQLKNAIERGQASTKIRGTSIVGLGSMTNELKRYKDALSVLGMSTSQQFDLISRNVKKVNNEVKGLRKGFGDMLPTLQRLASAFGVAFSVRGLAQFGKKLIETRGEFEMQFVAMKQIIGDVDAATKIWNQTMQQALQSPFKAMQLVTYTKQLAAYRIETEKLFDTTKRLADISAGLGVDMGRLILAYGQVKSANFLRASEVRQFTEAGVNIAGGLAKYFTELEGRAVGTAEVMERITKRMVLFSDVEEVFKRMTDEGGEFFNMQEVQADTVKGQIAKLHDAYDQMLNTIGQANQGVIRNFVDRLNDLVRNWQNVAYVLKWNVNWVTAFGAALFALSNKYLQGATTQTLWFSKALTGNSGVLLKEAGAVRLFGNEVGILTMKQRLGVVAVRSFQGAISALGNALRRFWPLIVFEGIVLLTERLTRASRELKRFREELEATTSDNVVRMKEEIRGYDTLIKKMKETTEGTMARKDVMDEISRRYGKYLDFIVSEKTTIEELAGAYDKVVSSIRNYTAEKIREEQQQKLEKGVYDEYQNLINKLSGAKVQVSPSEGYISISKEQAKQIAKLIEERVKSNPKVQYEELAKVINQYLGIEGVGALYNSSITDALVTYAENYRELGEELQNIRDDIEGEMPIFATEEEYKAYKKNVDDANKEIAAQNELYQGQVDLVKQKTEEQWKLDDEIAKLRLENEEKILRIRKEYGLISEGQYNDELARLHGQLDTYETDYNERLAKAMAESYGDTWQTTNKEARDMYNYVVSTEQALAQGTTQRNKQLKESYKGFKESLEQYNAQYQAAVNSGASKESLDKIQSDIDFATLMMKAIELAAQLRGIDLSEKKTTTRTTHENASKLISLIKEMRSEYDKLSKSAYGYAKSEEKVRESYKDSVKEILGKAGITDYDFTTNEGMIQALEKVKTYATRLGKDAAAEVQKYIDQLETEIQINAQVRIREDFVKDIEKAFNDYQLTLELQKLNISSDAAKDLFPEFDVQTLGQLQDAMQEFYEKQGDSFDEEDLKVYKQWSDKIDAEILKSRKDKAKQYSKFLEKEYSDRAKLEMQYAKDVAFVTANFKGEQQQNILKGIGDKYQQDISELTWKSFKESAFYVEMMDDLSSVPVDYMKIMLDKIEELLANPETLSPRALKEAINARQKILEAQMDFDQVAVMSESIGEIRSAARDVGGATWSETKKRLDEEQKAQAEKLKGLEEEIRCYEELQGQLKGLEEHDEAVAQANRALPEDVVSMLEGTDIDTLISQYSEELDSLSVSEDATTSAEKDENAQIQAKIEYLQRVIPLLEAYRTALDERAAYQSTDAGQNALFARQGGETSTSVGATITETKGEANRVSNRLSTLKKWQKAFTNFNNAFAKFNKNAADMVSRLGSLASAAFDLYDALGGETDAMTEAWKEFGSTIVNVITEALTMIPSLVAGFVTAGTTINAAMGIIGLIAEAIQLVLVLITGLSKLHDAGYEKEIENQQKKIDELQRAYERLEKAIDKTWDTASYIRTYNEEAQNLYQQIEALNKQMAAEESKKNFDKDKLQDYKDKIQDAEDELENLKQAQIEVFGGIGEEGYRDAAQGFVDAWKSAFLETGDGLQGLQDHFDEFLNEWFVKQATMRVAGKMLEPLFRDIDNAVEKYGDGGTSVMMSELAKVRERFGIIAPELSDALEELTSLWGLGGEGGLSGLAAGIQGMTEEQANILEAYWNSVRGYTANIDMNVSRIAQILGAGGDNTNPQIVYLESIANRTASIDNILHDVWKGGHPQGGGGGFKVFLN